MTTHELRKLIREEVHNVMTEVVLDKKSLSMLLAKLKVPKEHIFDYFKDTVSKGFSYKFAIMPRVSGSALSVDVTSPSFIKKLQKSLEESEFNVIPGSFKFKKTGPGKFTGVSGDYLTVRFMTTKN